VLDPGPAQRFSKPAERSQLSHLPPAA
jgi:hypothetical protein